MDIQGDFKDIFGQTFSQEVIKTVQNLYTFREEYRKLCESKTVSIGGPCAHSI